MRSVPHRVVCLLGLDDGEFPRRSPRDGDDVVLRDPHVGDRDARTEDRQLLLDALMAATERLIVTYTGNDERTNLRRPPAVPVGELLDVIDRTAGEGARERVLVAHPLQPFDPRNFAPPRSFDRTMLDGAAAMAGERREAPAFLPGPLPELEGEVVELEDLVRFVAPPGAGVPARAPRRHGRASTTTRSRTRCRSSSTGWAAGTSASGSCRRGWRAPSGARRSSRRSRAGRCRRASSAGR